MRVKPIDFYRFVELYLNKYGRTGENFFECVERVQNEGIEPTYYDEEEFFELVRLSFPTYACRPCPKYLSENSQLLSTHRRLRKDVGPKLLVPFIE